MSKLKLHSIHQGIGLTDLCFTDDGSHWLSCGPDGDIHLFNCSTDHVEHIRCSDKCYSIVVNESEIFISTNRNEIEVRSFPSGEILPSLIHLNQPASTICRLKSSIFIGTRDFKLIQVDLSRNSSEFQYFEDHQGPILSLNVHRHRPLITSSCSDGFIRTFDLNTKKLLNKLNVIFKSNDVETSKSLVKTDWDLIENFLSVPVENRLQFYKVDTWKQIKTFEDSSIKSFIEIVRYSNCSKVFFVSYRSGHLLIVDRSNFQILSKFSIESYFCSIVFNPKDENFVILTTINGEYSRIDLSNSFEKIKTNSIDDNLIKDQSNDEEYFQSEDSDDQSEKSSTNRKISKSNKIDLNEILNSTSTSIYLDKRFLIWNDIGAITSYSEQIHVSFHDVSYHHSITIDNRIEKYSIGDLSSKAILLASSETNQVFILLYQSWDSNMKQWSIQFNKSEQVQLGKLTENFLVIGTSRKTIRLFTLSGIEQRIIRIQSPLVSLSSYKNTIWIVHQSLINLPRQGNLSFSFIDLDQDKSYQGSLTLSDKSKLVWIGYSDSGKAFYLEKTGELTLLRETANQQYQSCLITNLKEDAEKRKFTNYWLLGINDFNGRFQVRVIQLRHQSYPEIVPWPIVKIVEPSICLIEQENERTILESDMMKINLFSTLNQDHDEDFIQRRRELLMKMFALASKTNRDYRAFEICQSMDKITLELAIKYATKSGKLTLAQKLTDFLNEKEIFQQIEENRFYSKNEINDKTRNNRNDFLDCQNVEKKNIADIEDEIKCSSSSFNKIYKKQDNSDKINDDFDHWKPRLNKIHLDSQVKSNNENEIVSHSTKRKQTDEEDQIKSKYSTSTNNKRNKLRQFTCQK